MFMVHGGVYKDTTFTGPVEEGTQEIYGPFTTYEEALEEWKRRTFTGKLDICTHRVFITEVKK